MVRVKICGLTREEDVDAAVNAGADAVGFIVGFPKSPRNLSLNRAAALMSRVPPFVTPVLVTTSEVVSRRAPELRRMVLGAIQLYGDVAEPGSLRRSLRVPLIRPHLVGKDNLAKVRAEASGYDAILSDTYRRGLEGGTGQVSDWRLCAFLRRAIAPLPLILSGGLNPENVADAIRVVRPFAVDVSSGVESTPGIKDHSKINEFIRRAKEVS